MNAREHKSFLFDLINTMIKKHCYIKTWGRKYRVMDEFHNPITNITPAKFDWLLNDGILRRTNGVIGTEIWICAVTKNPYGNSSQIKLRGKKPEAAAS